MRSSFVGFSGRCTECWLEATRCCTDATRNVQHVTCDVLGPRRHAEAESCADLTPRPFFPASSQSQSQFQSNRIASSVSSVSVSVPFGFCFRKREVRVRAWFVSRCEHKCHSLVPRHGLGVARVGRPLFFYISCAALGLTASADGVSDRCNLASCAQHCLFGWVNPLSTASTERYLSSVAASHICAGDHPTSAKGLSQARCVLRQWYRLHRGSTQLNPCMHCDEVLCSAYYLQARATPSCVRGSARGCVHV